MRYVIRGDYVTKIALLLKTIRELKGISQESLAERMGVSRQIISMWERGDVIPSKDNLDKWIDTLIEAKEEI